MKREKKQTYTYATKPSTRGKAEVKANKEGLTLSEKIDELLVMYVSGGVDTVYFDSVGKMLVQQVNKKTK